MVETIHKYPLNVEALPTIKMPAGAQVLCVQVQKGAPCLWAIVDPDQPLEYRYFRVCGTGYGFGMDRTNSRYIGTFQLDEGAFVGHVFELERR